MPGLMAIGYGTTDGFGWVDIGLFRRIRMHCGFTAAGHDEVGVAAFGVIGGIGVDKAAYCSRDKFGLN